MSPPATREQNVSAQSLLSQVAAPCPFGDDVTQQRHSDQMDSSRQLDDHLGQAQPTMRHLVAMDTSQNHDMLHVHTRR